MRLQEEGGGACRCATLRLRPRAGAALRDTAGSALRAGAQGTRLRVTHFLMGVGMGSSKSAQG